MKKTHRNRRSFWIDVTFSIVIIALTVSAISLISLTAKKETASPPENKKTTTQAPVVVDTTDSNYPAIKISTETSNDLYTPFSIQYPQSLHSPFNKAITSYIKDAKRGYLNKHDGSKLKRKMNISLDILTHRSGNYSFVLTDSRTTGKPNEETRIRSFHLNPKTGGSLTISDVLGHNSEHLEILSPLVREAIYNDPLIADYIFPEEVHIQTEPTWANFDNFAITDESLIFYFDKYELAAGKVGPPVIAIPLSDVNNILTEEFQSVIVDSAENSITKEEHDNGIKKIALTFDDGPHPKVTMQILETLNKYDAVATFFMLGSMVEKNPDIAKKVQEAGHELGNHTWSHLDLTKLGAEKVHNEIYKTSAIIENITGQKVTEFRPPYGAVNEAVRSQTNLPVILWNVDSLDWKDRDPNQLLAKIKSATKDGSTILMHDIHQSTADGLDAVLAYLQSEGYTFVKVSDLK
ncbi:polysaccharide deacetylase family protein [Sporosarcina sp. E16_3]|uniref:polysaccharide deacetylase family protein n=1 Tax=Sporosarcina sp. E16_3 TaxID=2789293 RepID=UPI001A91C156|nr:polysaccharide deacetylase family protein [Sporosarcina sp. E16_3]MBO0603299.1 polysaccharide deacetylase family protein [Sporosarcina sp. E16_3]